MLAGHFMELYFPVIKWCGADRSFNDVVLTGYLKVWCWLVGQWHAADLSFKGVVLSGSLMA